MAGPEQCPFRQDVSQANGSETAACSLLDELTGVAGARAHRVSREACQCCCRMERPSPTRINRVIASFLYQLTDHILTAGGVPGCSVEKAAGLQRLAFRNLAVEWSVSGQTVPPDRTTVPCCFLGKELGVRLTATARGQVRTHTFECLHPDHSETTAAACRDCRDWSARPRDVTRKLEDILPFPPQTDPTSKLRRWAVGVTTAPRSQPTLDTCLQSLLRAGWERPRLFVDGSAKLSDRFETLPVTLRSTPVGAWPNYLLALVELLHREPEADVVMLVQDDAVFYDRENLRELLDGHLPALLATGVVSLYCSAAYASEQEGWSQFQGTWEWGALAFVFPRDLAERFVSDSQVIDHRWSGNGTQLIDAVIGNWAVRNQVAMHFPNPSLVQHIGAASTIWSGLSATGHRRASRFAGDLV